MKENPGLKHGFRICVVSKRQNALQFFVLSCFFVVSFESIKFSSVLKPRRKNRK